MNGSPAESPREVLVRQVIEARRRAGMTVVYAADLEQLSVTRLLVMIEEAERAAGKRKFEEGLATGMLFRTEEGRKR